MLEALYMLKHHELVILMYCTYTCTTLPCTDYGQVSLALSTALCELGTFISSILQPALNGYLLDALVLSYRSATTACTLDLFLTHSSNKSLHFNESGYVTSAGAPLTHSAFGLDEKKKSFMNTHEEAISTDNG